MLSDEYIKEAKKVFSPEATEEAVDKLIKEATPHLREIIEKPSEFIRTLLDELEQLTAEKVELVEQIERDKSASIQAIDQMAEDARETLNKHHTAMQKLVQELGADNIEMAEFVGHKAGCQSRSPWNAGSPKPECDCGYSQLIAKSGGGDEV